MTRLSLVAVTVALLGAACGRTDPVARPPAAPAQEKAEPPRPENGEEAASAPSIYDLPIQVTDQDGNSRPLDAFRGHPVLITMFYAGCPNVCPLLTNDLERIDHLVPEPAHSDLRILMVSFDAPRDTPAVLTRLMKGRSLDPARWTMASAAEDEARELAAVLGIRYRKLDNGEYFHSSAILLLDAEGRPKVRSEGIGKDPAPILAALR